MLLQIPVLSKILRSLIYLSLNCSKGMRKKKARFIKIYPLNSTLAFKILTV